MMKLSYTSNIYRGYIGDQLRFKIAFEVFKPVRGVELSLILPYGMVLERTNDAELRALGIETYVYDPSRALVRWGLRGQLSEGTRAELEAEIHVLALPDSLRDSEEDHPREALARTSVSVTWSPSITDIEPSAVSDHFVIAVSNASRYLNHIPSLFHHRRDEFLWRLLMVFESVWAPLDEQIGNLKYYFDASMTPERMLPHLAGWMGFEFDDTWPEATRRKLLGPWQEAEDYYPCLLYELYRRRGTKWALTQWLTLYMGKVPRIIERRANDLKLGKNSKLGVGVALGSNNTPQTFDVQVQLPDIDHANAKQNEYRAREIRMIHRLIELNAPVNVRYTLPGLVPGRNKETKST